MASPTYETVIADDGSFTQDFDLTYPYDRTIGPTLSRFFKGLMHHRVEGNLGSDQRVFVPPVEFDPVTGTACTEWVTVEPAGVVETWSWQATPADNHPAQPFAWALVRLDGADVAMLHRVEVSHPDEMSTGMRVEIRWADETIGSIHDIAAFVPESTMEAPA